MYESSFDKKSEEERMYGRRETKGKLTKVRNLN